MMFDSFAVVVVNLFYASAYYKRLSRVVLHYHVFTGFGHWLGLWGVLIRAMTYFQQIML